VQQVLLDMVSRADRYRPQPLSVEDSAGPDDPSADLAQLAWWTEFHERVEQLPPAQREVFELRFYHGLTNRQIAELLGLAEKPVSRLWLAASEQVAQALCPDFEPC
jgi:RNA polymerase sigma factor (sigma-70 family)